MKNIKELREKVFPRCPCCNDKTISFTQAGENWVLIWECGAEVQCKITSLDQVGWFPVGGCVMAMKLQLDLEEAVDASDIKEFLPPT